MIVTALVMGFAGSFHCIGMCSPLAMAVGNMTKHALLNRFIYNMGRIFTYGLLGASVGSLATILPLSKYQNAVSIFLGIVLLFVGAGLLRAKVPLFLTPLAKLTSLLKKLFATFLTRKTYSSVFLLGTLNGILPCGLVWMALAYSITLQSPLESLSFMILFGAGTLPVMLGLTGIVTILSKKLDFNVQRVTSVMLIASGILLVARVFIIHLPHQLSDSHSLVDVVLCK